MYNKGEKLARSASNKIIDHGINKNEFYRLLEKPCKPVRYRKSDSEKP